MMRRFLLTTAIVAATIVAWGGAGALAQGDEHYAAAIHSGTCAQLGDEVVQLDTPQRPEGELRGTPGSPIALNSHTDNIDALTADELLEADHSVVISFEDEPVSCGEFGGFVHEERDENMVFGLAPLEDSGFVGVVDAEGLTRGSDDDFEVTVYVVHPEDVSVQGG